MRAGGGGKGTKSSRKVVYWSDEEDSSREAYLRPVFVLGGNGGCNGVVGGGEGETGGKKKL